MTRWPLMTKMCLLQKNDNEVRQCYGCDGPFLLSCYKADGLPLPVSVYLLFLFLLLSYFTIQDSRLRYPSSSLQ